MLDRLRIGGSNNKKLRWWWWWQSWSLCVASFLYLWVMGSWKYVKQYVSLSTPGQPACDACLSTWQKSTQSPSKIHWINTRVLIRSIAVICLMRLVSRHEWGREFTSNSETASAWCSTHFKDNINWYVLLNTPKLCDRTGKKSHWLYYDKDLTFITAYSLKENVWFCPWFSFAIGVIDL